MDGRVNIKGTDEMNTMNDGYDDKTAIECNVALPTGITR